MVPRSSADRGRRVFLVHGRDHSARDALTALLKAFDLKVIHWRDAAEYAGGGTPYTGDIVAAGMANADAVVVLLTPDDIGCVRPYFREAADGPHEREPTGQARLNVVFEAGMAFARDRDRVVLVEMGQVRKMSDVDGLNIIRMDDSVERRKDLARRLRSAGLSVDTDSDEWRAAGSFVSGRLISPSDGSEVDYRDVVTGVVTHLGPDTRALIIVYSPRSGFWPQAELVPDREGRFSSEASFGRNDESYSGKDYILMLVLTNQVGSASLRASRGHAISNLPPEVQVLDQATVIRRRLGSVAVMPPEQLTVNIDEGWNRDRPQSQTPVGRLTRPRGGKVNRSDTITGVVSYLPPHSEALILVQTQHHYWPQARLQLNQEGGFATKANFGRVGSGDSGKEFILLLVAAPSAAAAAFQSSLEADNGMSVMPPDVLVLDKVIVMRN